MEGTGYVDGLLAAYVMLGFVANMQKFFPAPIEEFHRVIKMMQFTGSRHVGAQL